MATRKPIVGISLAMIFFSLSLSASADENAPKSLDAGMARLQKLLGQYQSKDARQFRISIESELKNQPEKDKPPVLVDNRGEMIFGTPYRVGGAIVFDMVESIKRTIYELHDGDQKKEIGRQQRYLTARWTLRLDDHGVWDFDETFVAHSIPSVINKPYLVGSVQWQDNGIKLLGIATDEAFASEGKTIRAAVYGYLKLTRDGDELSIDDKWQFFHLGSDPDGNPLPIPDFDRPIGESTSWLTGKASTK